MVPFLFRGTIARTTLNVKSGSKTRLSAIFNAIFLFGIMILLAPLVNRIPLASLAGLLVILSIKMVDIEIVYQLLRDHHWSDVLILISTFLLTVFVNLTVGIATGMVIASIIFIKRMSETTISQEIFKEDSRLRHPHIGIYSIDAPLFFGTARNIVRSLATIDPTEAIILKLTHISGLDATGLNALKEIVDMHSVRHRVYLAGIDAETKHIFKKVGLLKIIGEDHIFETTKQALDAVLATQKKKDK